MLDDALQFSVALCMFSGFGTSCSCLAQTAPGQPKKGSGCPWQGRFSPYIAFCYIYILLLLFEGSLEDLEVKLPTIWTDEKQSRAEAERRERLEERRSEEKESEERRCRCVKR